MEDQLPEESRATVAHRRRKGGEGITPCVVPRVDSASPTVHHREQKISLLLPAGDQTDTPKSTVASHGGDSAADNVEAGAVKELYRAMQSAGFTAHTLFERLRRGQVEGNAGNDGTMQLTRSDAPPTYESTPAILA